MTTQLDRLNEITETWQPRLLIVIMSAAFILSYAALLALAIEAGYSIWLGWLWPLLLDGMIISSTLSLVKRQFAGQPTRYIWFLLVLSDGLSIGLNGYAAWPNWAFMAIHAAPPLVLVLLLKSYTNDAKDDAKQRIEAAEAAKLARAAQRITRAKPAANGEKRLLNNGNEAAPIEVAQAAKTAKIEERRAKIIDLKQDDPDLTPPQLAAMIGASADTIRRDLKALNGKVRHTNV